MVHPDDRAGRVITQSAPDNTHSQIFTISHVQGGLKRSLNSSYKVDMRTMKIENITFDDMTENERQLFPKLHMVRKQEKEW